PPGASSRRALRRRVSRRLRPHCPYDPGTDRTAGRHHHRPDRRAVLPMAAHKKALTLVAVLVALLAIGAAAPARQAARPGDAAVHRVISLVPAVTEMLYEIGAGAKLVAVSSYDTYPPEVKTLPSVGALIDPNVERILSLKPDLVVICGSQGDLKQQLARAGIGVFDYRHAGLAGVTGTIRTLGARTGD